MRAVVYNGPKDVSVNYVPDSTIEAPTDAPDAYRRVDDRDKGWTKAVLNPATS